MSLNKADLASQFQQELGVSMADCKVFVDDFFETMIKTLGSGEEVKLSGFGNFTLRDKRARPGRNPKTREEIPIEARRVVTFRAGLKFKARVG